jgi:hypothetical protein
MQKNFEESPRTKRFYKEKETEIKECIRRLMRSTVENLNKTADDPLKMQAKFNKSENVKLPKLTKDK